MTTIRLPEHPAPETFTDAAQAVERLELLYRQSTEFLCNAFMAVMSGNAPQDQRIRAFYPEIRFTTSSFAQVDSRLSFGHVSMPGTYATTVTRPDLFRNYLIQ